MLVFLPIFWISLAWKYIVFPFSPAHTMPGGAGSGSVMEMSITVLPCTLGAELGQETFHQQALELLKYFISSYSKVIHGYCAKFKHLIKL